MKTEHNGIEIVYDERAAKFVAEIGGKRLGRGKLSELRKAIDAVLSNTAKFERIECLVMETHPFFRLVPGTVTSRNRTSWGVTEARVTSDGSSSHYAEDMLAENCQESQAIAAEIAAVEAQIKMAQDRRSKLIDSLPRVQFDPEKHPVGED